MNVPLKSGDILDGAYHIDRVIGTGGMAIVFRATAMHRRQPVAVKMLLPSAVSNHAIVERFEREQRTLSQLRSEHVTQLLGSGTYQGFPYTVLEYLKGRDLEAQLKTTGPLPLEQAVLFILQACHAIAEAHSMGIVHRDIKPANLFLTRRADGTPCIKVLDFGISKASGPKQRALGEMSLTQTAVVMGSPFYMSPEQMISAKSADTRTDIWALGVTLYELLSSNLPFAAPTPGAVCTRILNDAPTPLRAIRPDYPPQLEAVIMRCLQRRPQDRFGSVADLAARLQPFGPEFAHHGVASIKLLINPTEDYDAAEAPGTSHLRLDEPEEASTVYLEAKGQSLGRRLLIPAIVGTVLFAAGLGVGLVVPGSPNEPAASATRAALPPVAINRPVASTDEDDDEDEGQDDKGKSDEAPAEEAAADDRKGVKAKVQPKPQSPVASTAPQPSAPPPPTKPKAAPAVPKDVSF